MTATLEYWRIELDQAPAESTFPFDRSRSGFQTFTGASLEHRLDVTLALRIRELARAEQTNAFEVMLAAFMLLLARQSGQDDLVVASPVADRPRPEIESSLGLFAGLFGNNLPLRARFAGRPSFCSHLQSVQATLLAALEHQEIPWETLLAQIDSLRDSSRPPIFQTLFQMMSAGAVEAKPDEAKFDTAFYVSEVDGSFDIHAVYNADLFEAKRIEELIRQYSVLLGQVVESPNVPVDSYSLVTSEARAFLADPTTALDEPAFPPVGDLFADVVQRHPDCIAVQRGDWHYSYAFMGERVDALADRLLAEGLTSGDVTAVTGPRSFGLYVSMTAVFASGGVLLSIDPALPEARKATMRREAGVRWTLAIIAEGDEAAIPGAISVCDRSGMARRAEATASATATAPTVNADDGAYIFFTSGTTGQPKGVLAWHKSLSQFLCWQRDAFGVGVGDRCAQLTGLSFDVVLRDIFMPLTSGATLCPPDEAWDVGSRDVLSWLARREVTVLHSVPSVLQAWLQQIPADLSLSSLRFIFSAGEPLTSALVERWQQRLPGAGSFVVLYGATENPLAKCMYRVPSQPDAGAQPVGWAIPNTQALVLADGRRLCGIGEPGEICIRTPFRTAGYFNDPELTSRKFVPNPLRDDAEDIIFRMGDLGRYGLDGRLHVIGRVDHQMKVHGVRVEPDGVAALLAQHPAVGACVVAGAKDARGDKMLVAYWVAAAQGDADAGALRQYLAERLPLAMIPAAFVEIDALPLTPNGKVDRNALPAPEGTPEIEDEYVSPRTPTEETVASIWKEVLGIDRVGVHDDFFLLGGHSLHLMELVETISERCGQEIGIESIFQTPTIAGLALALGDDLSSVPSVAASGSVQATGWPTKLRNGLGEPLFLCSAAGGIFYDFNLVGALETPRPIYALTVEEFHETMPELAATNLRAVRTLQETGPYYLAGQSFGGRTALEMASQLELQGERAVVILIDTETPSRLMPWFSRVLSSFFERGVMLSPSFMRFVFRRFFPRLDVPSWRMLSALPAHGATLHTLKRIAEFVLEEDLRFAADETFESLWARLYTAALPTISAAERRYFFAAANLERAAPLDVLKIIRMFKHNWLKIKLQYPTWVTRQPVIHIGSQKPGYGWKRWCENLRVETVRIESDGIFGPHITMHTAEGVKQWVGIVDAVLRDEIG